MPCTAYDADIVCDVILSYGWLAEHNILPNPRRHGLHFMDHPEVLWVKGVLLPKSPSIRVLEKVPIAGFNQEGTPGTEKPPLTGETEINQITQFWERHEALIATTTFQKSLDLKA